MIHSSFSTIIDGVSTARAIYRGIRWCWGVTYLDGQINSVYGCFGTVSWVEWFYV